MSLKARIASGKAASSSQTGFVLERPPLLHYQTSESFIDAVKDQTENLVMLDAKHLARIDVDGKIEGTDWRLSFAAFSDMCHAARMPVRFVKDLAVRNETLALDVIDEMLRYRFHAGPERQLVIDARCGRVEGIVGKDTYSPIPHTDVIDFTLTANPALQFTNGWLSGPQMRMTTAAKTDKVQPKKGDVCWIGSSVENAINGDHSVRVCDYVERVVCTNGMLARDHQHMARVEHRGDVEYKVQEAVLRSANRAKAFVPIMEASTRSLLTGQDILNIRQFIADGKNGGSAKLERRATDDAQQEAQKDGRAAEEITLWNYVNAITASAHLEGSLQRKAEVEALGYRTLVRFGAVLVTN